ncbi:MAG: sugar phosphate nucleotidyltransferase, partial [Bdellovibrionota bacterium]
TDRTPKPLVPLLGRAMVEYVLEQLARGGVTEAVINIHYLPDQMRGFVDAWNRKGGVPHLQVQDETREILDTGGAVALAAPWLFANEKRALVCNSDVLGTPDLAAMAKAHSRLVASLGVECTLAVKRHPGAGTKYTGLRREGDLVVAFERVADPDLWMFPGYYIVEASAVPRLPPAGGAFSVVEKLWKPLMAERKLGAWEYEGDYLDLGTVADLQAAEVALRNRVR